MTRIPDGLVAIINGECVDDFIREVQSRLECTGFRELPFEVWRRNKGLNFSTRMSTILEEMLKWTSPRFQDFGIRLQVMSGVKFRRRLVALALLVGQVVEDRRGAFEGTAVLFPIPRGIEIRVGVAVFELADLHKVIPRAARISV